jgi:putative FmdB family regulatory protein
MPIYDYVCHHCGHRFEVIHGLHAEGPTTCPVCGSSQVRKGFVAPTIVFKGTGWAKKDRSATSKPAEARSSSDGASSDGDGKPSAGKDATKEPTKTGAEERSAGTTPEKAADASAAASSASDPKAG